MSIPALRLPPVGFGRLAAPVPRSGGSDARSVTCPKELKLKLSYPLKVILNPKGDAYNVIP